MEEQAVEAFRVVVCMPYRNREDPDHKVQAIRVPEGGADAVVNPFKDVGEEQWRKGMNAKPGWYVVLEASGTICCYPPELFERKFVLDPDGNNIEVVYHDPTPSE